MALLEPLVAHIPVRWSDPDPRREASEDSPTRRAQRAHRSAAEMARDFRRLEGETAAQLLARMERLRRELLGRLGAGLLADNAAALDALLRDVDRLIADATRELAAAAERPYGAAQALGVSAAEQPVRDLQVQLPFRYRGVDVDDLLVRTARDNTVDLLSPPMQQFAAQIRTGIRRVATAGGQRMEEMQRLQRQIADAGLDNAAYRAERIVRTELGRVFGAATYARLEDLARTFSFLKKAWKATNDRRTRLGHREASQTYGRGKGIPIADRFQLTVYDERSKSGPKKLGVVGLRFPIDPLAEPAGRLAAASTILCRCHAAVDVDVSKYAEFARMRVQLALGGPVPPGEPPATPPATPVPTPARRPRTPRAPKPAPATPAPAAIPPVRAIGTPVSRGLAVPADRKYQPVRTALAVIDETHGDGTLPRIAAGPFDRRVGGKARAYYAYNGSTGAAGHLGFTSTVLRETPHLTTFHEVGHFLDHQGFGSRGYLSRAARDFPAATARTASGAAMRDLQRALENTRSIQVLRSWHAQVSGARPSSTVPRGVSSRHLGYLLDPAEQFARAYAQWVALRSGNAAALRELRGYQAASRDTADGRITATSRWSFTPTHQPSAPGTWQYPWQWQDDEFEAVAAAFDALFEVMGWRRPHSGGQ